MDEAGIGRVKARQFIDEYDKPFVSVLVLLFKQVGKRDKSLNPCLGFGAFVAIFDQGGVKGFHFLFPLAFDDARGVKGEFVLEETPDKEGFSYPAAAINSDKFRTAAVHVFGEQAHFLFATRNLLHKKTCWFCIAKIVFFPKFKQVVWAKTSKFSQFWPKLKIVVFEINYLISMF